MASNNNRVFRPKTLSKTPGFTIATLLRKKEVKGEIGIEIEVEGKNIPRADNGQSPLGSFKSELIPAKWWSFHHDGSLRGEENAEYVVRGPILFSEVPDAIKALWEMFDQAGSVLDESNRTSVHVHLNAQTFHLNRLCAFFALYFSVEEILTAWCGEHRIGNLFCLRAKDAPAIVSKIKHFLRSDGSPGTLTEGLHYAGANAHSLTTLGSIEIRALRGVNNPQTILDWVAVLERIYHMSAEYPDPRAVVEGFSGAGPLAFFETVLGPNTQKVKEGIDFDNQKIMDSMYEGIRLAQDLCYCRDWSLYQPVEMKADPFNRDMKKVMNNISQGLTMGVGLVESVSMQEALATYNELHSYAAAMAATAPMPVAPSPGSILTINTIASEHVSEDEDVYEPPEWPEYYHPEPDEEEVSY